MQYFIYYSLLGFFSFDFFYTAYLCIGDIALFSQSLHVGIVCIVGFTVSIVCTYYRKDLIYLHHGLMNGICYYESGEFYEELQTNMYKEKKRILIFWPLYYGSCAVVAIIVGPLVDSYYGNFTGQTVHPGVSLKLPISFWTPFDVDGNIFAFICMSAIEAIFAFIVAIMVAAGVVMCVAVMMRLCLHLELLIHSLETIDERTLELYNIKEGNTLLRNIDRQIYMKYYNECLVENIKHHQEILSLYYIFAKVVNLPIFVPFIAGAVLLAMAGVHVLSDDPRVGPKLTSASLVLGEMLNMLMLCFYGEKMKQMNEDLRVAIYSIKWYERDRCHKTVSIVQERTIVPMNIVCVYILEINMQTFASVSISTKTHLRKKNAF
ncbi:hypothetical protein O3M35_003127 [Rhynocoris fuscipes]|uniref:Odorant receptor n=1 Tax=Rhynocoris fuscipes TaxID=488301 RepID=A0AAW1CQJ3_9HEMI